ncbi:MAG: lytic murein transglycosylase [Rhodospirillales bacterium]
MQKRLSLLALSLTVSLGTAALAAEQPFDVWLDGVRQEARERKISESIIAAALTDVSPIPRVIELDRGQPEFTQTFQQYMAKRITPQLIEYGKRMMVEHRDILAEVSRKYGVQPRFIVALWGAETSFGRYTGGFKVIDSLATLAWDGRRSAFFRKELFNALTILNQGHTTADVMKGSWAGAMGQSQFMPSSYLAFAEDYNGDGRRDIWETQSDVFASIANYLSKSGWRDDQTWGRAVDLPAGFDETLVSLDVVRRMDEWQALGVRKEGGGALPSRNLEASVIRPKRGGDAAFLIYQNYRTLLKWNYSHFFGISVGSIADAIGD